MKESLFSLLFRCPHKNTTRPITPPSKPGGPAGQAYVVCLDCGGKFVYDWKEMRMRERVGSTAPEGRTWLARLLAGRRS